MDRLPGGIGSVPSAACVGLICAGLQMLGPDHLCTLMTISSTTNAVDALRLGASWGLAHSAGTVVICVFLQGLHQRSLINVEFWEHIGDYLIGLSLIVCSIYFALRESRYILKDSHGGLTVRSCDCHGGQAVPNELPPLPAPQYDAAPVPLPNGKNHRRLSKKLCTSAFSKGQEVASCETVALLGKLQKGDSTALKSEEKITSLSSGVLGLIQGLCCPMALVSINFMLYVPSARTMAAFIVVYIAVSVAGNGLFSFCWALLMRGAMAKCVSPAVVYRGSCVATFMFGVFWILANRFQVLDTVDIADHIIAGQLTAPDVAHPNVTLARSLRSMPIPIPIPFPQVAR